MAQAKLDLIVSLLGGAAAAGGLSTLRQSTEQLKSSLKGVQLKRELGQDLLALKARFNEVTKSGSYSEVEVRKVTRELAKMTANARAAGLNIGKLTTEMKQLQAVERGLSLRVAGSRNMQHGRQARAEAYGQIMTTAASAYSFYKPLDVAARYEDVVKDIAITGELTKAKERELAKSIRGLSLRYNQSQQDVAEAMKKLVETGMSQQTANALMPLMSKTATATRTDSSDAAKMARSFELLGVTDMELAFNQAAKAGKQGSFELRDMAKWFPALGGFMKELGVTGNEAVVSMASRMQVATRTAGSNDEAANNFKNFLTKLTSQDTIKDFKKHDVDLIPRLQAAARQGIDPIAAGVDLVMQHVKAKAPEAAAELKKVAEEVAKISDPAERQAELERRSAMIQKLGDRAGIGDVFQDMQAVSYLLAEIQNKSDLNRLMGEVKTGKNDDGQGTLDADYARRTEGMAEKIKGLKIAITDFGIAIGNAMMPVVDFILPIIQGLTRITTGLTETFPLLSRVAFGVLAGASAMSVVGLAMRFMGGGLLSTVGMLKNVSGWLLTTRLGMAANIRITGLYQTALSGLRLRFAALALSSQLAGGPMALLGQIGRTTFLSLAMGARAFGLALLTTPVGWVAAAIAALAFLVWKYWEPIKGFFTGLWSGLQSGFQPVMDALRPALAALRGAFDNLMTAIQPLMPLLKVLLWPLLFPLKLIILNFKIMWGWLFDLFTPIQDTGGAARKLGESFGQGIAKALTWVAKLVAGLLAVPTRMMQIGADMVNRWVGGIRAGWSKLTQVIGGLGSAIKTGFINAWAGVTSIFTGIWQKISATVSGGIAGVCKLIVNWSPLGLFYKAFSGVLSWFGVELPKKFTDFGANIINGLTSGIKSAIGGAVTAIGDFASGLKSKFTNLLGIKSPSRVFMGFGSNIGEGATLGILQSVAGVQGAAGKLAGVALAGAVAVGNSAIAGVNAVQMRAPATAVSIPRLLVTPSPSQLAVPVSVPLPASTPVPLGISQAVQAAQPQMAAMNQAARNHANPVPAAAAQGGMTIHFSPNISVGGENGGDVRGQVQEAMKLSMRELEQMMRRVQAEKQRRAF